MSREFSDRRGTSELDSVGKLGLVTGIPPSPGKNRQPMISVSSARSGTAELDLVSLRDYMQRRIPLDVSDLSATLIAGGRSNPTYLITDGTQEWVLRRPPDGTVLETAHDMSREYRVITALAGTTIPVPVPVALCVDPEVLGAPFYLMERIRGRTLPDPAATAAISPGERARLARAMVDLLASLHEIDPASVGLADWGRPGGYLRRQLHRWRKQWDSAHSQQVPVVHEVFRMLSRNVPETKYPGIVHGDFKIDNIMVAADDPGTITGLLDWEMSTLGDTLCDVGLLLSTWDEPGRAFNPLTRGATALAGFPTANQVLDAYLRRRTIDQVQIGWYVAFADLKLAVILEGINVRHQAGYTVGESFDGIAGMVQPLVDRALETARSMPTGPAD